MINIISTVTLILWVELTIVAVVVYLKFLTTDYSDFSLFHFKSLSLGIKSELN